MSVQLKIQITPEAQRVISGLQTLPVRVIGAIAGAMKKENQFTIAHIQAEHLTGQGPFPVEQHKLGVRTNRLRGSVRASDPVIADNNVDTSIGSNVIYAAIHEFGGRIHKPERNAKVRLRTDARGNLVRQLGKLAVFAKSTDKRARESDVTIGAHDIEMPERAPFRTGIAECAPNYTRSISAAIIGTWSKLK